MNRNSAVTAAVLGAIVLVGIYQGQFPELLDLEIDETILLGASNVLLVYFILALLIERGCEVVMDLLTAVGAVPPKVATREGVAQSGRRLVSMMICLVFAVVVSLAGLRLVETVLELATGSDVVPNGYFAVVDALLTSLILAGGSDGLHQIIRSIIGEKAQPE